MYIYVVYFMNLRAVTVFSDGLCAASAFCEKGRYPNPFQHQGTADAENKVPSVENTELTNVLPFSIKAWGTSEYSHACFAHCQEFLPFQPSYFPRSFPCFSTALLPLVVAFFFFLFIKRRRTPSVYSL